MDIGGLKVICSIVKYINTLWSIQRVENFSSIKRHHIPFVMWTNIKEFLLFNARENDTENYSLLLVRS